MVKKLQQISNLPKTGNTFYSNIWHFDQDFTQQPLFLISLTLIYYLKILGIHLVSAECLIFHNKKRF